MLAVAPVWASGAAGVAVSAGTVSAGVASAGVVSAGTVPAGVVSAGVVPVGVVSVGVVPADVVSVDVVPADVVPSPVPVAMSGLAAAEFADHCAYTVVGVGFNVNLLPGATLSPEPSVFVFHPVNVQPSTL